MTDVGRSSPEDKLGGLGLADLVRVRHLGQLRHAALSNFLQGPCQKNKYRGYKPGTRTTFAMLHEVSSLSIVPVTLTKRPPYTIYASRWVQRYVIKPDDVLYQTMLDDEQHD